MSDTGSSSSGQTGGGRGKVEGKGGERIPSDGDCEHLGKKKRIMERRGSGKDNEERGIEREEGRGWKIKDGEKENPRFPFIHRQIFCLPSPAAFFPRRWKIRPVDESWDSSLIVERLSGVDRSKW